MGFPCRPRRAQKTLGECAAVLPLKRRRSKRAHPLCLWGWGAAVALSRWLRCCAARLLGGGREGDGEGAGGRRRRRRRRRRSSELSFCVWRWPCQHFYRRAPCFGSSSPSPTPHQCCPSACCALTRHFYFGFLLSCRAAAHHRCAVPLQRRSLRCSWRRRRCNDPGSPRGARRSATLAPQPRECELACRPARRHGACVAQRVFPLAPAHPLRRSPSPSCTHPCLPPTVAAAPCSQRLVWSSCTRATGRAGGSKKDTIGAATAITWG